MDKINRLTKLRHTFRCFWAYFGIFPFVGQLRCFGIAPSLRMEIYSKYPPKSLEINF